jgi:hypothetical protein
MEWEEEERSLSTTRSFSSTSQQETLRVWQDPPGRRLSHSQLSLLVSLALLALFSLSLLPSLTFSSRTAAAAAAAAALRTTHTLDKDSIRKEAEQHPYTEPIHAVVLNSEKELDTWNEDAEGCKHRHVYQDEAVVVRGEWVNGKQIVRSPSSFPPFSFLY